MSKLMRAGLEAITTIVITLGVVAGAFGVMFGFDNLLTLSGLYYGIWAAAILISHLVLANRKRHLRLGIGVALSGLVMVVHLVMYLTNNIATEINVVPVILHDFGFALISLVALSIVHLVIFRRREPRVAHSQPIASQPVPDGAALPMQPTAPTSPSASERVNDVPAPVEDKSRQTA